MDSKEPDFTGLSIADLDVMSQRFQERLSNFGYMINQATMPSFFNLHTSLKVDDAELDLMKKEHAKYQSRYYAVSAEIEKRFKNIFQ